MTRGRKGAANAGGSMGSLDRANDGRINSGLDRSVSTAVALAQDPSPR